MSDDDYPRIPEADYRQALDEARRSYEEILSVYDKYGYAVFNLHNIQRCLDVAEQFAMKVRGKNITIQPRSLVSHAP